MAKKIGLLITVILVSALIITTITLGAIKKDYSPSVQTNFQSILITNNSDFNYAGGPNEEKESYKKIVKLYNESFKQSLLASLFGGNLSNKITVTYASGSASSAFSTNGFKMAWDLNSNGEKIKLTNNLETEYVVNKLFVGIEKMSGFKVVTIYAKLKDTSVNAHLRITTKANFEVLYDYLEKLAA